MKRKLIIVGCCLVALLATIFTSCKQEVSVPEVVTISYVSEFGTLANTENIVEKGYKLKAEDLPTLKQDGYTFDKWYINKVEAKADAVINKDTVLVAKWIKVLDKTAPKDVTFGEITAADGKAVVNWTIPENMDTDLKGFELSVSPNHGTLTNPVILNKEVTSFSVSDLKNGTKYTFKIRTFDNNSIYSKGITTDATPIDTSDKTPPREATFGEITAKDGNALVTWTNPKDKDFNGVILSMEPAVGTLTKPVTLGKDVNTFRVDGLSNGTEYTFKLITFDNSSIKSTGVTQTANPTDTKDYDAPAEVTECLSTNLDSTVALRWTDPSDTDLFGIEITYTPKSTILTRSIDKMVEGSIFIAPKTEYVEITKLANDIEYTFTLKTMDLSGNKSDGITVKSTPHKYKVGDILLSDGSYVLYNDYQNSPKITPVAVVCGFKTNGHPLGLGLKQSDKELAWTPRSLTHDTKFDKIVCTPLKSGSDGTAKTATFEGDIDGSDNWNEICEKDTTAASTAANNYPAFDWVNNYGTKYSLPEGYKDGWYMPSIAELTKIYRNKKDINEALKKLNASQLKNDFYWSSSQDGSANGYAWLLDFGAGTLGNYDKDISFWVRSVRAF